MWLVFLKLLYDEYAVVKVLFWAFIIFVLLGPVFFVFLLGVVIIVIALLIILYIVEYYRGKYSERKEDYNKRIKGRMQEIERALREYPDVTVRKGDEKEGILPKAYKINIYNGLKNTNTNKFEDSLISINFRISEDFKGLVVSIRNVSNQKIYIKWAASTVSDSHVFIDDVPYNEYMSLGELRPGAYVSKTLRRRPMMRFLFEDDVLRQNFRLTNNAAYVIRIPITLESGKKIRYKFPIVTERAD